jgi:hypothetical protein
MTPCATDGTARGWPSRACKHEYFTNVARRPFERLLRSRLVSSLTSPRNVDDYLQLVDASWSVWEVRARVVDVRPAGDQSTSLLLKPNGNWKGFRAGQFVQLSVAIGGVRRTRCFSLSSAPEDGARLRVTIKAMPGGRVSSWAAAAARAGDVVGLSQAVGDFVLPAPSPATAPVRERRQRDHAHPVDGSTSRRRGV